MRIRGYLVRMKSRGRRRNCSLACALAALAALAAPRLVRPDANPLSADEVRARWQARLAGRHFTASIVLSIDRQGQHEQRRLTVWRDDVDSHRERVMARFEEPPDLRGLGVLYIENPSGANEYFLYQPTTRRVRRIGESMAREDVYGIDLEYLGFGLAVGEPTRAESVAPEPLAERATLRLTERAVESNPRFDRRTTWLDPITFIPVRTIQYQGDAEALRARTEEVRSIQGVPTPTRIVFEKVADQQTVTMEVPSMDYEAPIPESYFSTMALIKGAAR
jgi:hypothetical protein